MSNWLKSLKVSLFVLVNLLWVGSSSFAVAQESAVPATTDDKFRLDVAVGLKGGLNGSWATEVPETATYPLNDMRSIQVDPEFYPMFGLGGDVGVSIDVRALGIIGIETGVRLSFDNGEGWNDKKLANSEEVITRVYQNQATTSMRIPLLLKVSGAQGTVRPVLGLGVEFVNQIDSTVQYRSDKDADPFLDVPQNHNKIEPSSYTTAVLGFGLEINFDRVRIPIELRAHYNIDYSQLANDRVRATGTGNDDYVLFYDGAYMGHFNISIGFLYNFDAML